MKRLVWSATAQRDVRSIIAYYAQFDRDLPDKLIDRIDLAARKLIDFPRLGPQLPNARSRCWQAKGTPFVLVFRPLRDGVHILRVRHGVSDWKPRA